MNIRTDYDPKPGPTARFDWSAIFPDTYDGAPDAQGIVGYGATEAEAIADLLQQAEEQE